MAQKLTKDYPCLFVVDEDGLATGIVYHFCSVECRAKAWVDPEERTAEGTCGDAIDGTQCCECGIDLELQ